MSLKNYAWNRITTVTLTVCASSSRLRYAKLPLDWRKPNSLLNVKENVLSPNYRPELVYNLQFRTYNTINNTLYMYSYIIFVFFLNCIPVFSFSLSLSFSSTQTHYLYFSICIYGYMPIIYYITNNNYLANYFPRYLSP